MAVVPPATGARSMIRTDAPAAAAHGITPLIPHKDNELARTDGRVKFDKEGYKRRCIIEQTIGWLKECRRIGTRFEKLAINFLAMMKLAMNVTKKAIRVIVLSPAQPAAPG